MEFHKRLQLFFVIVSISVSVKGFPQQRSTVGVHIILNPVQTIHVDHWPAPVHDPVHVTYLVSAGMEQQENAGLSAFGTAAYEVVVKRMNGQSPVADDGRPRHGATLKATPDVFKLAVAAGNAQSRSAPTSLSRQDDPIWIYCISVK